MAQFTNELLTSLSNKGFTSSQLQVISESISCVARDYEITKKETSIAIYNDVIPNEMKQYLVCMKVQNHSSGTIKNERKGASDYLFTSIRKPHDKMTTAGIRKWLDSISLRSGIDSKRVTPHTIRHSFATHSKQNGMPIESIQALLGHTNIQTTMRYIDLDESDLKTQHSKYVL